MQAQNNEPPKVVGHRQMLAIAALLLMMSGPAFAIPSPDLVINLSASVAQLLGLLSVVFGGFALKGGKKSKKKNNKSSKTTKLLLGVVGVLLVVSFASNILQFTAKVDANNQRLQANLVKKSVENGSAVGDTSLKTLSFSDQKVHPQGISTDTLAKWLESDKPLHIIDVREDEEFETGAIEGAAHVRYPDLLANSELLQNTGNTLLLCYSGNRSSELCDEFTAQGKSCNFMVGGYEKWLSESRQLGADKSITSDELRQIADFKNKTVLLDTPEVKDLVQNENAEFIDVRYPGDFIKGHLPGAHNITMRALNSKALDEKIDALPNTPLVAACYDKRSCFYSQVIGLRLERAGKDYRGRYTVPHEYTPPATKSERAHVAAWKQQNQSTAADILIKPLAAILNKIVDLTGHYVLGLIALVLLVRFLLLPLSLKAERDTAVQKSLKGRIDELKEELGEHPRALSEATFALYKRYKIRPVINMLASLFQLSFMLLFYSAVSKSAPEWSHSFLWIQTASLADPYYILPLLASAMFVGVISIQSPPKTRKKMAIFGLCGIALFALLFTISAAANLYLAISMAFLVAQSVLFKWISKVRGWSNAGLDKTNTIEDTGLIPLSKAHFLPESTGKKAARLGELIEAGYNVPDGFVFTSAITNRAREGLAAENLLTESHNKELNKLWRKLKTNKVAVRSSGANEDGEDNSFAGVYESVLNVSKDKLIDSVVEVYASLQSDRSAAYTSHTANPDSVEGEIEEDQGGVVVQKMVPAEYAGVMFTEHPGKTGAMMIEMVSGLGEELVSGNVTPDTFAFGKITGEFLPAESSTKNVPPIDTKELIRLGAELESLFNAPQDIEWAYAKGKFFLLQARDITRSVSKGHSLNNIAENERLKLVNSTVQSLKDAPKKKKGKSADKEKIVFVQNELSELLPRPTPLSADFMAKLWEAGGSTDLACQDLNIPYDVNFRSAPYITTVFGWMYVNKLEEARRLQKGPGAVASFQLARNAENTETEFRETFLPQFQQEMIERNAIDYNTLSANKAVQLLERWVERFVEQTYREAEIINISADYHVKSAIAKLTSAGFEPTQYLNNNEETVVTRAMSLLNQKTISMAHINEFLEIFGHRAPLDYELAAPRFNEDPELIKQYISRSNKGVATEHHENPPLPKRKVLAISVSRAQKFQVLKEEAKHYCLIELAQIRKLLLAIDRLTKFDGMIFELSIDEVLQLTSNQSIEQMRFLAKTRQNAAEQWKSIQLPTQLSVADLESINMLTGKRSDVVVSAELSGNRVAGESEVTGVVRVITDVSEIESFKTGEILVARMTDPTWYPLFSQASGIITEVGGWLSHAAIVAREYDLPAIVGANGICQQLKTGDVVKLQLDGNITLVEDRRSEDSLLRANESVEAASVQAQHTNQQDLTEAECTVYQLTEEKIKRFRRRTERRALKNRISDRRATVRTNASGEIQQDRRASNRAANLSAMLKAS